MDALRKQQGEEHEMVMLCAATMGMVVTPWWRQVFHFRPYLTILFAGDVRALAGPADGSLYFPTVVLLRFLPECSDDEERRVHSCWE